MSATVTIVSLFPELLNINGDAANATVLETRARWSGLDCRLARVGVGDDVGPERPEIVVIGSGSDAELPVTLAELRRIEASLREWVTNDVPILAIGTSWELLSDYVDTGTQPPLEGLGIFSGHTAPAPRRIASELVVDSPFGRLFGFENHARTYRIGAQCQPLGTVVHGTGNGEGAREGVLIGNLVGTHLHGPVLARNPALADHLLSIATARTGYSMGSDIKEELRTADAMASAARAIIATQLGLSVER